MAPREGDAMRVDDELAWRRSVDQRLDRLVEAMSGLVRIEERSAAQMQALERFGHRLDDHEERIRNLEIQASSMAAGSKSRDRLIWSVVSGLLGIAFGAILWVIRG